MGVSFDAVEVAPHSSSGRRGNAVGRERIGPSERTHDAEDQGLGVLFAEISASYRLCSGC